MTVKTGKYVGDQLLHAISCDNDTAIVNFMYFPHHMVEATQVLNGIPCILSEELLFNPNDFINRSGIEQATMSIWDKEKRTYTDPNELYNEKAKDSMLKGTGLTELDLNQDPQAALKKKTSNFDEADIQKYYSQSQGKGDKIFTIASR